MGKIIVERDQSAAKDFCSGEPSCQMPSCTPVGGPGPQPHDGAEVKIFKSEQVIRK